MQIKRRFILPLLALIGMLAFVACEKEEMAPAKEKADSLEASADNSLAGRSSSTTCTVRLIPECIDDTSKIQFIFHVGPVVEVDADCFSIWDGSPVYYGLPPNGYYNGYKEFTFPVSEGDHIFIQGGIPNNVGSWLVEVEANGSKKSFEINDDRPDRTCYVRGTYEFSNGGIFEHCIYDALCLLSSYCESGCCNVDITRTRDVEPFSPGGIRVDYTAEESQSGETFHQKITLFDGSTVVYTGTHNTNAADECGSPSSESFIIPGNSLVAGKLYTVQVETVNSNTLEVCSTDTQSHKYQVEGR